MIRSLFASLCLLVGACAGDRTADATARAPAAAPAEVRRVEVATLKQELDRGAVSLLIDVRTPGEFAGGHVPGAKNLPLDELDGRVGELGPAGAEVYVICQSGGRSARAGSALVARGYRPVDVRGGTSAWRDAGYAVE